MFATRTGFDPSMCGGFVVRRGLSAVLGLLLVAGLIPALSSAPAQALEAPVAFTSAKLPTYQTNGIAWTVAAAGGRAYVGGTFTSIRPPGAAAGTGEIGRSNFAVLDAATGNPTSCAPSVTGSGATVRALSVSPDQETLYIGGFFSAVNGVGRNNIAALDLDTCSVVTSFRPLANGTVRAITSDEDAVYYGGSLTAVGGVARAHAAAAAAVGTATPGALLGWNPSFDLDVRAIALKPDSSVVVVGGDFNVVNGASGHALAVVNPTSGATVKTWQTDFIHAKSVVKALAVDDTGFYTGNEGTGMGIFDGRLAVNWGTYAERWRDTCLGATQTVVVHQGVLYAGHHAHDCLSMGAFPDGIRWHFTAQSVNDPTLLPWFPNSNEGLGEALGPRGMAAASTSSGNYMWAVGEFTTINGTAQQGMTRFGPPPDTVAPSNPVSSVTSTRSGQVTVAWRRSLDTDDATLTYRVFRDGSSTPIHTVTGVSWFWNRRQLTYTDTGLEPGSVHTYRVSASDGTNTTLNAAKSVTVASGSSAYQERVQTDGATFHWRYDEPADVFRADSTGNDNNGTSQGGTTPQVVPAAVVDDPSRALSVSGGTTTIYSETFHPAPTTFTAETWFKTTTTSGGKLMGFGDKQLLSSLNYDRHIYMTTAGRLIFGVNANSVKQTIQSPLAYNNGAWHHVAASQGPGGIALYVDGIRVARNTSVTTAQNYSGFWRVGGDNLANWTSRPTTDFWVGTLDETAVYPKALSGATITDHYQMGTGVVVPSTVPTDFYGQTVYNDTPALYWRLGEPSGSRAADWSGNGATGTYAAGVARGVTGAVVGTTDKAVTFNGTSTGRVATDDAVAAPSAYSLEAWVRTNTSVGGRIIGFSNSQTGTSTTSDRLVYMRNDGRITFGARTSGGVITSITSSAAYNNNVYHHVVATRGSTGMALYVDGVLVASLSSQPTLNYTGFWRAGGDTLAGWPSAPTNSFIPATVDELAVYDTQLTLAQVRGHHSAGNSAVADLAPPTLPTEVSAAAAAGEAALSWQPSSDNVGVTGYEVHRSTTPDFTPTAATRVSTVAGTSTTETDVPYGLWYYRIVAKDAAGNASIPSDPVSLFITDVVPPSAPGVPTATTNASSAALSWPASTDNIGVTGYVVYRSTSPGFTPGPANEVTTVVVPSFLDSPLVTDTYHYKIKARDAAGNLSNESAEATAVLVDNVAPSDPAGVTVNVVGTNATVSWEPSTDDGTVTGYDVYRSDLSGFTPGGATLIGSPTGTSFLDSPAPEGTSYYRVVAKDGGGNRSLASTEVTGFVTPFPSVVTLFPEADTYANQGAATTNFGTTSSLFSRGSLGAISYMRFVVPPAPAGKNLTSAVLRFRTNTDTAAGSIEPHTISFANNSWSETALVWNGRPALIGDPLGFTPADTVPNTAYTVGLDVPAMQTLVGGEGTLAVSGTGTDSLWFWSRSFGTTASRPQLVLTYAPGAPTKPAGLSATVDSGTVNLSWSPSSHVDGITGYDVYRSGTAGFIPGPSNLIGSVTDPSYVDPSRPSGSWFYKVVSKIEAGERSDPSNQLRVDVDNAAPSAPTALSATPAGASVGLSWTASTDDVGVTGYTIYRSAVPGFTPTPGDLFGFSVGTTYTDQPSTGTWYYRVVANDAFGHTSAPSNQATASVDAVGPSKPTDLTATVAGATVDLSWTASTDDIGVSGYDVYRSASPGITPSAVTLVGSSLGATFTDPSRPVGTWYYRVVARDAAGNSSEVSDEVSAVVLDETAPSAPSDLTATPEGQSVGLLWTESTDDVAVTGYTIYRSDTPGFTPGVGNLLTFVAGTSYLDAPSTGTWYYQVDRQRRGGTLKRTIQRGVCLGRRRAPDGANRTCRRPSRTPRWTCHGRRRPTTPRCRAMTSTGRRLQVSPPTRIRWSGRLPGRRTATRRFRAAPGTTRWSPMTPPATGVTRRRQAPVDVDLSAPSAPGGLTATPSGWVGGAVVDGVDRRRRGDWLRRPSIGHVRVHPDADNLIASTDRNELCRQPTDRHLVLPGRRQGRSRPIQ